MFYFYCPNCGFQETFENVPENAVEDINRYGYPIYIHNCKHCNSEYAGFMKQHTGDMTEKVYQRSIIALYQEVRKRPNEN